MSSEGRQTGGRPDLLPPCLRSQFGFVRCHRKYLPLSAVCGRGRVAVHNLRFIRRQKEGWEDIQRLFDDRGGLLAISTTRSTYSGKQHIAFKKSKNTRKMVWKTKRQKTMSTDWTTSPHRLATHNLTPSASFTYFDTHLNILKYELIFEKIF